MSLTWLLINIIPDVYLCATSLPGEPYSWRGRRQILGMTSMRVFTYCRMVPWSCKVGHKMDELQQKGGNQRHNNSMWGCGPLRGKEMRFYRGNSGKKKSRLIPGSWQSWAAPPSLQRCLDNQGDDRWSWSEEGQQSFYKNCKCGSRQCSEAGRRERTR